MTTQYENGETVYDTFAEADAESGEWVTLSCSKYTVPEGSSMTLYFETDTDLCDFWLDDVSVMKYDDSVQEPVASATGDVNGDGEFNAADVVLLSKWMLDVPDTEVTDLAAADFIKNDVINIADFCMMKSSLIFRDGQ